MTAVAFLSITKWIWNLVGIAGLVITSIVLYDAVTDYLWVKYQDITNGKMILARGGVFQGVMGVTITALMVVIGLWSLLFSPPRDPSRPVSGFTIFFVIVLIMIELLVVVASYGSLRIRRVFLREKGKTK